MRGKKSGKGGGMGEKTSGGRGTKLAGSARNQVRNLGGKRGEDCASAQ